MKESMRIGNVQFNIETPYMIPWKVADREFITDIAGEEGIEEVEVLIQSVDALDDLEGRALYRSDSFDIWLMENGKELRAHRAMFAPGHPIYAHSYWENNKLIILYDVHSNVWNNVNMSVWNLLHLENNLLDRDGLILHCCYLEHDGEAILLTAPSGTGKTTHANLWKKCYNGTIINGDRALLQRIDGVWKVYGYPIHGSADECENRSYPVKGIAVIRQGKDNHIETLSLRKKVSLLFSECTVNMWNENRVNQAFDLLTDLAETIPVAMLHCTMEDQAAHTLYEYLYGEKNGII